MIEKTSGIVLHSLRYGESSVIIKVFTRSRGLQSYLVSGVRKPKAKIPNNLFQPLTIIDIVAYHKEKGGLQHIKEVSCPRAHTSIPYDIMKSSIAMFLSEVLVKSIKEQDPNTGMYDFLTQALEMLDRTHEKVADFHLVFLIHLSRFLGFQPRNNFDRHHCFFNLREGLFQRHYEENTTCLNQELSLIIHQINTSELHHPEGLSISNEARRSLLKVTIDYYSYHLEGFQGIRSHLVLETVLG